MVVCRIHAGHLNGLGNLGRQIFEAVYLPLKGPQPFQFGVFAGRYEITADPPMAGDGHGFSLRRFPVASESPSEFCGGCCNHRNFPYNRKTRILRNLRIFVNDRQFHPAILIMPISSLRGTGLAVDLARIGPERQGGMRPTAKQAAKMRIAEFHRIRMSCSDRRCQVSLRACLIE